MCDAVTASIVATIAGSAAQAAGQAKARKAMEGAQVAERVRQKGFQDQSQSAFSESLAHANPQDQANAQGKAEGERKAAYDAATAEARAPLEATGRNLAGSQDANRILSSESAARSAQARGYAGQQGAAKAALQGFGDTQLGNALYNARQMQNQGTIGNFMQGSAAVLPYEVDAASHRGDSLKSLGDLLSMGGAIAGLGAGAGWWGGADKAAQAAGTLGSAGSNASNLATLGTDNLGIANGGWDFGAGVSKGFGNNLFNTGSFTNATNSLKSLDEVNKINELANLNSGLYWNGFGGFPKINSPYKL
jgi:hypothetical protein